MIPPVGYVLLEFPRTSETFILNEMLALAPHGIPARIFCLRGQPGETQVPAVLRDRVEYLHPDGADPAANPEAAAARLADRCKAAGIRHLHCHYANLPAQVGLAARREAGVTVSFTGHAKDIFTMDAAKLGRRIAKAAFVVGCSGEGCRHMAAAVAGAERDKIHCVHHGLRPGEWDVPRGTPAQPPLVVAVGRLTPKKGFPTLVRATALLRDRGQPLAVEIIGEGRERGPLENLARELGVEGAVSLPGSRTGDQIRARFAVASAFVMPSIILPTNNQDGIANSLLEALAAGLPVVAADLPSFLEVLDDGVNALIFPSGDAEALADRLGRILGDPVLSERLRLAARTSVAGLDTASAAEKLAGLFRAHVR